MGVSFCNLNEHHSHAQAQSSSLNNNHQAYVPLYPVREGQNNCNKVQLVPTCDHDMLQYPNMMGPRFMNRGMGSFGGGGGGGGGFGPQRRPRFGYDGWGGGPGFGLDGGRQDTICGYCGAMAHPGPCDGGGSRGGWSRSRLMRGGGGDIGGELAASLNNLSTALNNGILGGGGGGDCGPTCSSNDGGIRLKGNVGDHDVDLKFGGKQKCPCDEDGGCETSHKRAKSRSRSRKRRERRGRRRARRREKDVDEESSDGEQSRGRPREKRPLRGGDAGEPRLPPRMTRLEDDVERLNNGWHYLKTRISDLPPRFPARPDLGLPDGTPYELGGIGMGRPELSGMPLRPGPRRTMRPVRGVDHFGGLELPARGNRYDLGMGPLSPLPEDFDAEDGLPGMDFGGRLGGLQRDRPGPEPDEEELGSEFADLNDPGDERRMRAARSMPHRGFRGLGGFRGRRGSFQGPRAGIGARRMTAGRDTEMTGGRTGMPPGVGTGLDDGWESTQHASDRASNRGSARNQGYGRAETKKATAECAQDSPRPGQRAPSRQATAKGELEEPGSS